MRKLFLTHRLASVITAVALMSESLEAYAENFSDVTENVSKSVSGLPKMISTVAYIGGIGMGVAGVYRLKQHVDNPSSEPMKNGLIRLGAGGALLSLPYMTQAMSGSVGDNADGVGFEDVNKFKLE